MEITQDMIVAFANHYGIDHTDGTQVDGIVGSITTWAEGQGELDAALVNGNPTFAPVVEAYFKAKGMEVPETVKVPLTHVEGAENTVVETAEAEEPAGEKLPEAETPAT